MTLKADDRNFPWAIERVHRPIFPEIPAIDERMGLRAYPLFIAGQKIDQVQSQELSVRHEMKNEPNPWFFAGQSIVASDFVTDHPGLSE